MAILVHPEVQNTVTDRILTEINNEPLSQTFCLITGDCVNTGGVENDWQDQFFNPSYINSSELKLMVPYILARGNLENYNANYNSGNATVFYKYWPYTYASGSTNGDDMYWSFDYGPVHIAVPIRQWFVWYGKTQSHTAFVAANQFIIVRKTLEIYPASRTRMVSQIYIFGIKRTWKQQGYAG